MKRGLRTCRGLVILAIVVAAALYTQRVNLGDYWRAMNAPALPEEVGYEEVVEEDEEAPDDTPTTPNPSSPEEGKLDGEPEPVVEEEPEEEPAPVEPAPTPASINLAVPFTSQAPFAVWDEVHGETCEEASVYMVIAYYRGVTGQIPAQTAEDELQRLVALEQEMFGFYEDTTALQTASFSEKMYGNSAQVFENPTADDIKAHLSAGRPVIIPAAGQLLGNPNFSGDGPPYHMLVIRGYADGNFIANDPGTRNGNAYLYSEATIMNAIHDWTGSYDTVESGAKAILVIYPN